MKLEISCAVALVKSYHEKDQADDLEAEADLQRDRKNDFAHEQQ